MLSETRTALRIKTTAYDDELVGLIQAGAKDLEVAGVVIPGDLSFTKTQGVWTDASTLTDNLVQRAIITYVRMNFGSPDDYDRLAAAYTAQKVTLMHASDYTNYGGDTDGES